jgi:hypothetical protein
MVLRWQRGLFLPEAGLSNIDKAARETAVEEAAAGPQAGLHRNTASRPNTGKARH